MWLATIFVFANNVYPGAKPGILYGIRAEPPGEGSPRRERKLKMPVRIYLSEESMTAYLMGEIDHHTAKEIREEIDDTAGRAHPKELILDFRDVTFMDSSGIGLVMGRYSLMQELEGVLRVVNQSGHIRKVMKLAGLDRLAVIESGVRKHESNE